MYLIDNWNGFSTVRNPLPADGVADPPFVVAIT
jgi:hypothetical protein